MSSGYNIKRIAVLGAGEMGASSAAVFAQAVPVYLLNRAPLSKAERGLDAAVRAARSNTLRYEIALGTFEDDLERIAGESDLILECLAEDPELKRGYFQIIDKHRKPGSIVATGSSGLSIADLARGMSDDFRRHFLGLHFYNPPLRLPAAEIISGPDTSEEVLHYMAGVMETAFRRVVLYAADKPAYAGNRIGFKQLNEAAQLAVEHGVELVDYLFGSYTGRLLAPLATIDLVGWDVHQAIVDNIYEKTADEAHESFSLPPYMAELIGQGVLGNKTPEKGGFFKTVDTQTLVLDLKTGEYVEPKQPTIGAVEKAKELIRLGNYRQALDAILNSGDEAALVRRWLLGYISYSGMRNGEVSDMRGINRVMGWGFNWIPPDALADIIGVERVRALLEQEGFPVPPHLATHAKGRLYNEVDDVARYLSAR